MAGTPSPGAAILFFIIQIAVALTHSYPTAATTVVVLCISTCKVIEVTELVECLMNNCIIINFVQ